MSFDAAALWDAAQITFLRLLTRFASIVDALFDVRWGERLLERLTRRWQIRLAELDRDLAELERDRARLNLQAEALAIHVAAVHLGGRYLLQDELRFDPSDAHDKETLDAAIDVLVKPRLAAIDPREVEPGHYVYYLEPDWDAIRARLSEAVIPKDSQTPSWLLQGIQFIDEVFLSEEVTAAEQ